MSPCLLNKARRDSGFTLIELLVSVAILCFVVLVLAGVMGAGSSIWQKGLSDTQHRQRARAALDFIGEELKKARLPHDRTKQDSLRFEINPVVAQDLTLNNRDSIFWQAPIASEKSQGDLATLGYFVRWDGVQPALYRFFLNPSSVSYVRSDPNKSVSSVTDWDSYQFLDDVAGLWINAYNRNDLTNALPLPFDSRVTHRLPAIVEITIVMIDSVHAKRLTSQPAVAVSAQSFIDNLPAEVRPGATQVSLKIHLENETGW